MMLLLEAFSPSNDDITYLRGYSVIQNPIAKLGNDSLVLCINWYKSGAYLERDVTSYKTFSK